jgi:hypothetical protein
MWLPDFKNMIHYVNDSSELVIRYYSKMKTNNFLSSTSVVAGREMASKQASIWKSNTPVQVVMAEGFLAFLCSFFL